MGGRVARRVGAGTTALVVGFLGGAVGHRVLLASERPEAMVRAVDPSAAHEEVDFQECPLPAMAPPYPENGNGMTYGSGARIDADDPGPDLIAAYGTNGRCGYIRAADRDDPPRTLEEALALDPAGHDVPLYARDGVTVIGKVQISSGRPLTSPAPEPSRSTP